MEVERLSVPFACSKFSEPATTVFWGNLSSLAEKQWAYYRRALWKKKKIGIKEFRARLDNEILKKATKTWHYVLLDTLVAREFDIKLRTWIYKVFFSK